MGVHSPSWVTIRSLKKKLARRLKKKNWWVRRWKSGKWWNLKLKLRRLKKKLAPLAPEASCLGGPGALVPSLPDAQGKPLEAGIPHLA